MFWNAFWAGVLTQASIIVAIGAQNAYVLQQGIKRQYIWPIILFCICSDLILVVMGVYGGAKLVAGSPILMKIAHILAISCLLIYAFLSFRRVFKSGGAK